MKKTKNFFNGKAEILNDSKKEQDLLIEKYKKKLYVKSKKSLGISIVAVGLIIAACGLTAGHFAYKASHTEETIIERIIIDPSVQEKASVTEVKVTETGDATGTVTAKEKRTYINKISVYIGKDKLVENEEYEVVPDNDETKPTKCHIRVFKEAIEKHSGKISISPEIVKDKFEVTFITGPGAEQIKPQEVEDGGYAVFPHAYKEGFNLKGWYLDKEYQKQFDFENTPITSSITLYAKWEEVTVYHTVTFNSNYESGPTQTVKVKDGSLVSKPLDPIRTDYVFAGWFTDEECSEGNEWNFATDLVNEDKILYAKWEEAIPPVKYFTVTFDSNYEGGPKVNIYAEENKTINRPMDPIRDGFIFEGWYKDAACSDDKAWKFDTDVITEDTIIYAKWYDESTTIGYKLNDSGDGYLMYCVNKDYCPTTLIVPATYNNKPVVGFYYDKENDKGAFEYTDIDKLIFEKPSNIRSISNSAFYDTNLTDLEIFGCTNLETIGEYAFYYNDMTSLVFPSSLKKIGVGAFYYCDDLEKLDFSHCKNLEIIDDYAFYYCDYLKALNLSGCSNLKKIGKYAFYECDYIENLDFKDCVNLRKIGDYAFSYDDYIEKIDLSPCINLKEIDYAAFYYCEELGEITFPASLNKIGQYCFEDCETLYDDGYAYFNDRGSVWDYGGSAWNGFPEYPKDAAYYLSYNYSDYEWNKLTYDSYYGSLVDANYYYIDAEGNEKQTTDPNEAEYCKIKASSDLSSESEANLYIPSKFNDIPVKCIEDNGFENYTNVVTVYFEEYNQQIKEIGSSAFRGCTGLKHISIPESVTKIKEKAFEGCSLLKSVTFDDPNFWGSGNISFETTTDNISKNALLLTDTYYNYEWEKDYTRVFNTIYQSPSALFTEGSYFVNMKDEYRNKIESVIIPEEINGSNGLLPVSGLAQYDNYEGIFQDDTKIRSVKFEKPENIVKISNYAFYDATRLENISLKECINLETIGFRAFCNAGMKHFYVPASVKDIGASVGFGLSENGDLETIEVDPNNTNYESYDNGLIRKKDNVFLEASASTSSVKEGVVLIGTYSFNFAVKESINFPSTITNINDYALYHCKQLKQINFNGTKEQWNKIKKNNVWAYGCDALEKIVCTDGEIIIE